MGAFSWIYHKLIGPGKELSAKETEAIRELDSLIQMLKEKKREWKKFYPRYALEAEKRNYDKLHPLGIPGPGFEEIQRAMIHWIHNLKKLDNTLKEMRAACISLSSIYIRLLKSAIRHIKTKSNDQLREKIEKILQLLKDEYSNVLSADWLKRLNRNYRLIYKMKRESERERFFIREELDIEQTNLRKDFKNALAYKRFIEETIAKCKTIMSNL